MRGKTRLKCDRNVVLLSLRPLAPNPKDKPMARFPRDSRSSAMLAAALAGAVVCAVSGVTVAKEASRSRAAAVEYPEVATAASPRVLGEFNGVKVYGGGFGSALALDPRAPGYFYLL